VARRRPGGHAEKAAASRAPAPEAPASKAPAPEAAAPLSRRLAAPLAAVLATGVLFALASPAAGISPAVWLALVPGGLALCRARSRRGAIWLGLGLGAAATAALSAWLVGTVEAYHGIPPVLGWPLFAVFALVGQLQLPLWSLARWWLRDRHDPPAVIALALAYAGLDWLVPKLFKDTLAVACFADARVIQLVDVGGPFLLTFVIVLVSQAIVAVIARRRAAWPAAAMAGAVLAAVLVYGQLRGAAIRDAAAVAPRLRAAVAQANIGNLEKLASERGDRTAVIDVLRAYGELSDREVTGPRKPDLLVWPETAYPLAWGAHRTTEDDAVEREMLTYARERNVSMVFGGYHRDGDVEFNSAVALAPDGRASVYHKYVLVPFAETYPFPVSLLREPLFGEGGTPRTLDLALPGASRGDPPRAGAVTIAPIICYEALVPSHVIAAVRGGARVIVNLTNDAWFGSTAEKRMHLASSVLRSVETRRAQIRATNTGITALILPDGEIVGAGPIDEPAALAYDVPLLDEGSPALELGAWGGPACALGAILMLGAIGWRRRRATAATTSGAAG
jgi:apolipoprotein N-acyltransferase